MRSSRPERRRRLEHLLVQIDDVGADRRIVGQHRPRQRVIAPADAQETAERHHRVGDPAGDLVDHDVVDRAERLALAIAHGRALDLVARDQARGFAGLEIVLRILIHSPSPQTDPAWRTGIFSRVFRETRA